MKHTILEHSNNLSVNVEQSIPMSNTISVFCIQRPICHGCSWCLPSQRRHLTWSILFIWLIFSGILTIFSFRLFCCHSLQHLFLNIVCFESFKCDFPKIFIFTKRWGSFEHIHIIMYSITFFVSSLVCYECTCAWKQLWRCRFLPI
jgi:hypothetical protein